MGAERTRRAHAGVRPQALGVSGARGVGEVQEQMSKVNPALGLGGYGYGCAGAAGAGSDGSVSEGGEPRDWPGAALKRCVGAALGES